jgi:hypothetical protein
MKLFFGILGSFSQRYRSGDPDPDPHQNVTDPESGIVGRALMHTVQGFRMAN